MWNNSSLKFVIKEPCPTGISAVVNAFLQNTYSPFEPITGAKSAAVTKFGSPFRTKLFSKPALIVRLSLKFALPVLVKPTWLEPVHSKDGTMAPAIWSVTPEICHI